MASSRVKATTTIALSVIEDVLTLATTIVASSIAFSMRSIGFVLLKSPHVVPVFKRGAREREYAEIRDEEKRLLEKEKEEGLDDINFYKNFSKKAEDIKNEFHSFLIDCKKNNLTVCGYGAAAKGNTLLNYSGIKKDLILSLSLGD